MWTPKKYLKNENGNVAMMFAIVVTTVLVTVGVGVDYTNMVRLQSKLQGQVDAGVLAAATADVSGVTAGGVGLRRQQEEEIRRDVAFSVVTGNGFEDSNMRPDFEMREDTVYLKAELNYSPFFGRILGRDSLTLSADSESGTGGLTKVDVVLVLDSTDSMSFEGKLDALKEGATSLIETIEDSNSGSKIGLVPFSRYARLNDNVRTKTWFELPDEYDTPRTSQQATNSGGTCTTVPATRDVDGVEVQFDRRVCEGQTTTYTESSTVIESRWEGCVGTRTPPNSERDEFYVYRIPGLLNEIPREVSGLSFDEKPRCPSEIVPMSTDYDRLKSAVQGMRVTDRTHIPTGIIWGQRVLSPGEPFDNTPEPGQTEARQIMIIMTDGDNTTQIRTDAAAAAGLNAPPYIDSVDTGVVAIEANAATRRLCDSTKERGIEVYTIAFKVTDANTKTLLRNCASDPSKALTPESNQALINEFERISDSLVQSVRLIR